MNNEFEPFEHKHEDLRKFYQNQYINNNVNNVNNDQLAESLNSVINSFAGATTRIVRTKQQEYNVVNNDITNDKVIVVNAHGYSIKGQHKCPSCGSTEINIKEETGKLVCNYCRCEFEDKKVRDLFRNVEELNNEIVIGAGALDIEENASDLVTIECGSCGAEIVVDTKDTLQAKCHWCRNILSVNNKVSNGCIPDGVLPFKVTKKEAMKEFKKFLKGKKLFAASRFNRGFKEENIMGVYFPYMVVDTNTHIDIKGVGEVNLETKGSEYGGLYDIDVYKIDRNFNLVVRGLTVEANKDKLNKDITYNTNNIINSILPFDTANAEVWNANYMKGFSSEKRDLNIEHIKEQVDKQNKDIYKTQIKKQLKKYRRRGYRLESNCIDVKGQQWKTLYLPVWIYSYAEGLGKNKKKHYLACNARTGETMGSVPFSVLKMTGVAALATAISSFFEFWILGMGLYSTLFVGPSVFAILYSIYGNAKVRHNHEFETRVDIKNMKDKDEFDSRKLGVSYSRIQGATRDVLEGNRFKG